MNPKEVTVYMIGNAHIDPVWLWRWQEGFAEVLATCRSALDRMREFPEFVFTRADAATYRWVEEACPEMFEEIGRRVSEGRWSVVGGWWEQSDCNIPCGESFVRHALYGKRYFLEKFGVDVDIGYNIDSFGHCAGLPQILAKAGIKYYVFMRPNPAENPNAAPFFWWQGPDGSRVLAHRVREPYCTGPSDIQEHVRGCAANRPEGGTVTSCFYGVGNHGGGPTIANIESIKRLRDDPQAPNLVFGTLRQMFEHALNDQIEFPTVQGDLHHHAVGCYSAHSAVKTWNRRAENALIASEKFCALAKLECGRTFPKREFASAWQKLLFCQFHDILAGTSLESAYEDVRNWIGAALDTADYHAAAALSQIACGIDTRGEGAPFVVFNPHAHEVTCAVYLSQNISSLLDHAGRSVPVQTVEPVFEHTGPRPTKIFVDSFPALGYRLYYGAAEPRAADSTCTLRAHDCAVENASYRVEADQSTGEICRITDLRLGVNLLSAPAAAIVMRDDSDTWSHGVTGYKEVVGRFGRAKLEYVETGPVRAVMRIETTFGESRMWQDVAVYERLGIIEFRVTVDWREKHRVLKFEFPLAVQDAVLTCEAAYAAAVRPADGRETPSQKWIDLTGSLAGRTYGVAFINNGLFGFDAEGGVVRLTALRSPVYAFHEPRRVEPGKRYRYMEQGLHEFSFALVPHSGGWQEAGVAREALIMNAPPVVIESHRHPGSRPPERSFGSISAPNVDLCAIKEAEDDDSLIVRLHETSGRPTDAVFVLGESRHNLSFQPFELKTLKAVDGGLVEVDLVERTIPDSPRGM